MPTLRAEPAVPANPFPLMSVEAEEDLQPVKQHFKVLSAVRNLINELEQFEPDLEVIGSLDHENLPKDGEYFLTLAVAGDDGGTVTKMGLENGRLFFLLSENAKTSQLAVLDLFQD
jgi:hypothetical protein